MAGICELCGKNIGIFGGYTCDIGTRSIAFCSKCSDSFFALKFDKNFTVYTFDSYLPEMRKHGYTESGIKTVREYCENKKAEDENRIVAQKEKEKAEIERLNAENEARLNREIHEREQMEIKHTAQMNVLKTMGHEGYYEYKVISLEDNSGLFNKNSGRIDVGRMSEVLNELGMDGWHLVVAYSNELGKNAVAALGLGLNSSIDEHILIFERFRKI